MASHFTQVAGAMLVALLPLTAAQAQLRPELSLSAGPAYSLTILQRTADTPAAFQAANTFGLAGNLRLAWPLAPDWMLETRLGLSELEPGIQYRFPNGSHSTGVGMGPLLQAGLSVRRLGLLAFGSRLRLDVALGSAVGRLTTASPTDNVHNLTDQRQPAPDRPVVVYKSRQLHRNTLLLSGDVRLRYALTASRSLLLSLEYVQGLRPLVESRTQQLLYVDADGRPREGGFVVRNRASHVALQLGYGWLLGQAGERATTRTPRYGRASRPPEELPDDEDSTFSEPTTE